jgi:small conductance mechanosensitive channel
MCTVLLVLCMVINGLVRRHAANPQARHKRQAVYSERLRNFGYTLAHLLVWLAFIELGLRVWGLSLIASPKATAMISVACSAWPAR